MKPLFLICAICLISIPLNAEEIQIDTSSIAAPSSPKQLQLLAQLSERHQQLLDKEAALNAKESALNAKEEALNQREKGLAWQVEQTPLTDMRRENQSSSAEARLYMQMPRSKAVALLELETSADVAKLLSQMPSTVAGRLIEKMPQDRGAEIIKKMREIKTP